MAPYESAWAEIAERHGLVEADIDRLASWWHTDADLGRAMESSPTWARAARAGFTRLPTDRTGLRGAVRPLPRGPTRPVVVPRRYRSGYANLRPRRERATPGGCVVDTGAGDPRRFAEEGSTMSLGDKAKDVTQKVAGKVEEAVGHKTDDAELTHQGQKDQVMGEGRLDKVKAKDAFDGK